MHPKTKQRFDIGSEDPLSAGNGELLSRHSATVRALGKDSNRKKANWNLGQGAKESSAAADPTNEESDEILKRERETEGDAWDPSEQEALFFGDAHGEPNAGMTTVATTTINPKVSELEDASVLKADNRKKLVETIRKKSALHGQESLNALQRAIMHDEDMPRQEAKKVSELKDARDPKADNRRKYVETIRRKRAMHGRESMNALQRAIMYDEDMRALKKPKTVPTHAAAEPTEEQCAFDKWEMGEAAKDEGNEAHEDPQGNLESEEEIDVDKNLEELDDDSKDDFMEYLEKKGPRYGSA